MWAKSVSFVLVVESCGAFLWRAIAHRLEGSRFGMYTATSRYSYQRVIRPKNVAAGGSR